MPDKTFLLEYIEPLEFYGVHDQKLNIIRKCYPDIQFTARGFNLNVKGPQQQLERFELQFQKVMAHYMQTGLLTTEVLEHIFSSKAQEFGSVLKDDPVLLFGPGGNAIRTRTANQQQLADAVQKHALVFAVGPAGTGKTYTAVALAVQALKRKSIKRIILTRPAVEAGENLGFLPGDLKEKLDPYMQPLYDALADMIPPEKLKFYIENRTVQIAPLAFMRGRTLDHAFVILDEAQNIGVHEMKTILTRLHHTSKIIICGDTKQVDERGEMKIKNGLTVAMEKMQNGKDKATINPVRKLPSNKNKTIITKKIPSERFFITVLIVASIKNCRS